LVVLAKAGDNAGFFVGGAIGKRHPFPRISPGKTVAGCVASLVAGVVVGAILLPLTLGERTPLHVALGALIGGVINVAAQAGDLSESWVKRRAGVKDSSALLGPSGGVLDVIDSLLLAAPVALLAWTWAYPAAGR
jgi:phosphatidate cytidylyltransferase